MSILSSLCLVYYRSEHCSASSSRALSDLIVCRHHVNCLYHSYNSLHWVQVSDHRAIVSHFCLQAIGDPGQGWANAVLYILLSPTIRHRLSWKPCRTCKNNISELLAVLLESYSHTHAHVTRPTASYHKRVAVVLSSGSRPSSERVPLMGASSDSGQCYESVSCSAQPELVHCSVNVCGDNVDRSTSRELTHTAQHSLLAASDSVDRSRELTHTQHSLLAASAKVV